MYDWCFINVCWCIFNLMFLKKENFFGFDVWRGFLLFFFIVENEFGIFVKNVCFISVVIDDFGNGKKVI